MTQTDSRHDEAEADDDVPPVLQSRDWRQSYARRLVFTDAIVVLWAVFGALLTISDLAERDLAAAPTWLDLPYPVVAAGVFVLWMIALVGSGSRGYRKLGTGNAEYRALLTSCAAVFLVISIISVVFQASFSRLYLLIAIPSALIGLILERWLWRIWLRANRRVGQLGSKVLVVGGEASASSIIQDLLRAPEAGYFVVGAVISTGKHADVVPGTSVPVLGTVRELERLLASTAADTVLVVGGHNLTPAQMRQLSWSLEPGRQHLVVTPSITDIAGPRIHSRPVNGLPLVHVETPRYEGWDRSMKRAFDIAVSGGLLLIASIPLLLVAAIIKLTSPGPLFFSHERIGRGGHPFQMLKFRSMVPDADAKLGALLAEQGKENSPLFKIDNDPRITPIGRFIRRYSIDEIPQLINVLRGDMSLVGPRPQVAREVALYNNAASRRLIVKPGMTGLWQVSGRSNLNWEESVRLDLYYVENWSLTTDLSIMLRTVRAVLAHDGAV